MPDLSDAPPPAAEVITRSTITCPRCGAARTETMPLNACQYFYECTGCGTLLRPKPGDCCVFCSYGSLPCPPVQSQGGEALCCQSDEGRASQEIRPGVFRPDWRVVTRPAAREALLARHRARAGQADKPGGAPAASRDLTWRTVLELFAGRGHPPGMAELAQATGLPYQQLRAHLQELHSRDLLCLDPSAGEVVHAYPFSGRPTDHRVELRGRTLFALCAIDALGIGGMFGTDVAITSSCRFCATRIEIGTAQAGHAVADVRQEGAVVWFDPAYGPSAATSCCPLIGFFCCDDHLRRWLAAGTPARAGHRLTVGEAMEVGRAIFEPILAVPAPAGADRDPPGPDVGKS